MKSVRSRSALRDSHGDLHMASSRIIAGSLRVSTLVLVFREVRFRPARAYVISNCGCGVGRMSDEMAYLGRNLNSRTMKALEEFQMEASRIKSEAALAG